MSTHSVIGKFENNKVRYIFCNFDGVIDINGVILHENYDDDKLDSLLDLGDLAYLGESLTNSDDEICDGCVLLAYSVNNVLPGNTAKTESEFNTREAKELPYWQYNVQSMEFLHGAEYVYLWKDGRWIVQYRYLDDYGTPCYSTWNELKGELEGIIPIFDDDFDEEFIEEEEIDF